MMMMQSPLVLVEAASRSLNHHSALRPRPVVNPFGLVVLSRVCWWSLHKRMAWVCVGWLSALVGCLTHTLHPHLSHAISYLILRDLGAEPAVWPENENEGRGKNGSAERMAHQDEETKSVL